MFQNRRMFNLTGPLVIAVVIVLMIAVVIVLVIVIAIMKMKIAQLKYLLQSIELKR